MTDETKIYELQLILKDVIELLQNRDEEVASWIQDRLNDLDI